VIRQGGDGLDLLAVQRDDELLDRLGARRAIAGDDEVTRLLAALAAEVDNAMPAAPLLSAAPVPAQVADAETGAGRGRRLGAAGVAAAVLLGGSVALSGAAAAVTGDPLAPYKTVGHAVGSVGSAVGHALSFGGGGDLPEQAAPIAHLQKRLAGARAALAHGDTAQVQALVDELTAVLATADLTDEQRAALQQRLDQLEDSLARAASSAAERGRSTARATAAATPGPRDGTAKGGDRKATDPAEKEPKVSVTQEREQRDRAPADREDKAPADKAPADEAPDEDGDSDTSDDTTSDPTSDTTQQQVPAPQPTSGSASGGRGRSAGQSGARSGGAASEQSSTELGAGSTAQRGQGASRR
jgi:hypothetical protein